MLHAKFIKSADSQGNLVKGSCRWDVFNLDKLVFSMTVDQITQNTSGEYDDVATEEFGKWLMKEIRDYNDDI